jgi:peptidylprolyl isomerase
MTIRSAALLTTLTALAVAPAMAVAADPTPATSPSAAVSAAPSPGPTGTPIVLKSGLQYIDDVVGTGPMPKKGQKVAIKYTAMVGNKRIEASSPAAPFEFVLGSDQAMKGLDEGVSTMKVGGKRRILVPPELGYGNNEVGNVPPNSIIIYEVELLSIK